MPVLMIDRLTRAIAERAHLRRCRPVLATPPLAPADDSVVIFSMIGTRVILPYLVAAKSFARALGRGRIVLLDDGTLTAADRTLLDRHLGKPEIRSIAEVDTTGTPRGGCWERLLTLAELAADAYVIQLDSDTVTVGAVPDVVTAVAAGRGFTILGGLDAERQGLLPLNEFRALAYPDGPDPAGKHVQHQTEARLDRLAEANKRRYVRAGACFTGFPQGSLSRADVVAFSQKAERLVGRALWSSWGSEQVASNFLVANTSEPVLLPYRRYRHWWDDEIPADVALVHFAGTHRYTGDAYATATARALAALS